MPLPSETADRIPDIERLALLIDALGDYAIYMVDERGHVISWNMGAQRIKGYAAEEIMGRHFSCFFTVEDRASGMPEKILASARLHGRHESEGWRLRKDGRRFWANAILQPVRDARGALIGFAKITRDMTERLAAQQALRDSERRFRMLVEGVADYAICMLDPSGVVTNWNKGAERLKGYGADEILGQHFSRFHTKEDRAAGLPARVLETAARVGRYECEGWRVRKDGSRFWASVVLDAIRNPSGVLEGFAEVTRDITERRAAQEALRESERQLRLLIAGVTDYGLFMLDPNGIVTSWNSGAQRIKGYVSDEIVGQHFSRFYTERDRAAGLPTHALAIASQDGRYEAEGWRIRKDGTMFWANVVIDAIRDEQGQLVGFAKITRDVTERREAQNALQEAQAQRAAAQKMEALGQLTGGVAHDFNNLLMVVSGNIRTLKKVAGGDPKLARAAQAIELAAQRGEALTRQLLTFSRRQTYNPSVFQVGERIDALRTMLAGSIGDSVKLVTMIGPEVWPVKVDASELELALVNVVLNARDAMPDGGVVSVTAENVTLARGDTKAEVEGDFVALRISDTGCGIAPDVMAKVFDPFFTTKQVDRGTGLGLSQVYGFAHQSGGTVTIDSELGKGTTVTIYAPRAQGVARQPAGVVVEGDAAGEGTVLVVEDDPDVRDVTASMLEQLGYTVQGVGEAAAALEALAKRQFDLVVSDIVMPGAMDGVALAQVIRQNNPSLPVLLVSGYSRADTADFVVLRKPFVLADLGRTIGRMIAESRQPAGSNLVRLADARRLAAAKTDD